MPRRSPTRSARCPTSSRSTASSSTPATSTSWPPTGRSPARTTRVLPLPRRPQGVQRRLRRRPRRLPARADRRARPLPVRPDARRRGGSGAFRFVWPNLKINVLADAEPLDRAAAPAGPERSSGFLDYFFAGDADAGSVAELLADRQVGSEDRALVERVQKRSVGNPGGGQAARRERAARRPLPGARRQRSPERQAFLSRSEGRILSGVRGTREGSWRSWPGWPRLRRSWVRAGRRRAGDDRPRAASVHLLVAGLRDCAARDESRLFVVQQGNGGLTADIKLVYQGAMTTFLTVDGILSGGERGLLSMAFAPDYETSRLLRLLHR